MTKLFARSKIDPNAMKLKDQLVSQFILLIILFTVMFPLAYVVGLSFNPDPRRPTKLEIFPAQPTIANYTTVFDRPTGNPVTFLQLLGNSITLSVGAGAAAILVGVFAAYSFSRFKYRGREFLMIMVFALTLIPQIATLVPLYVLLNRIRASNTVLGLIFLGVGIALAVAMLIWLAGRIRDSEAGIGTYIAGAVGLGVAAVLGTSGYRSLSGPESEFILRNSLYGVSIAFISGQLPFTVWNLKGYLDTIPKELEEAARIDGASFNQTFFRIVLPLAAPALAVTLFLSFLGAWTEFYLSWQFLTDPENYTLAMTLWNIQGQYAANVAWNLFASFSVIITLPVALMYLAFQRQIVGGLTIGGVKG